MPTAIIFANGKQLEVAEGPDDVFGRLNAGGGLVVRFDAPDGDETKIVYVNPLQVACFEETPPFDDRVLIG